MKKQVIGITGGIGCGKSVVMDILEKEYHAAVILADTVGHDLMKPGAVNYNSILEYFGNDILNADGEIDRKKLGAIVFGNQEKLSVLNQITHPNIFKEIENRITRYLADPKISFVCLESAILYESGLDRYCDKVLYVYAAEEVRIKRLIEGRGYTEDYCRRVMTKQKPETYYREKADMILDNSKSVDDTKEQLANLF